MNIQNGSVWMVLGTRPEAIKLAPVASALAERGLAPHLVLTGQHPLDPAAYRLAHSSCSPLELAGSEDPRAHAAAVAQRLAPLLAEQPALLIVQGDTSSALGGALAGFAADVPVAHVEAGLRSFDSAMPWPEEDNRVAIDAGAAQLFAPTKTSAANLRCEGVPGAVHVTGNSGIDALFALLAELGPPPPRERHAPARLLVTCHRRENWGTGLTSVGLALIALARSGASRIDFVLHPNPKVAAVMHLLLGDQPGIRLVAPLDHRSMIAAMRAADIILSDSGGMQEEAPALGVPLLVLRDKTERPEGIASGNLELVGTGQQAIVAAVRRLLDQPERRARMARPALPFGDGASGPRIAAIIATWLAAQGRVARPRRSA